MGGNYSEDDEEGEGSSAEEEESEEEESEEEEEDEEKERVIDASDNLSTLLKEFNLDGDEAVYWGLFDAGGGGSYAHVVQVRWSRLGC
jgi:hypothetical protein